MRIRTVLALAVTFILAAGTPARVVVVPVADLHAAPSREAAVVTQAIYAAPLVVEEDRGDWLRVRTPVDDYPGWVPRDAVAAMAPGAPYAGAGPVLEVTARAAHLYREPDVTRSAPLLTVPYLTRLEQLQARQDWFQVRLPDDRRAWLQRGDALPRRRPMTVAATLAEARRFLGTPYTWGGSSSFGYDCSGFCQMLMKLRGYDLPRDAGPQAAWDRLRPVARGRLRPGDLLYFGHGGAITHTGMYMGRGRFIHATSHGRPEVQISRLADPHWRSLLMAQRRALP